MYACGMFDILGNHPLKQHAHGYSRLVGWCGVFSWVCFVVVPSSVILMRTGLDYQYGLPAFALGSLLSLLITIGLAIAYRRPRYFHHRRAILKAVAPSTPWALFMVIIIIRAAPYPAIHDVSTDPDDPPIFDAAPALRGPKANPVDINPEAVAIQRKAYPELRTITTPLGPEAAFQKAMDVAESLEWLVYNSNPRIGVLEASYTSELFGFVDDVVIRVRGLNPGAEVDLRSVSRVGKGDMGANAKRISQFIEAYER